MNNLLFLVAGEPSGDNLGAKLVAELLKNHFRIAAVAGPKMRALPIEAVFPMESLQVMGFIDVALALPKLIGQFKAIRNTILKMNPKAVICIDYPGFNLRLEKSLRKHGYKGKLIHFVCPTVWAWGKGRIKTMEKNLDLLLTLFPFEQDCFAQSPLNAHYVGHPLTGPIARFVPNRIFPNTVAIFPGSRKGEIERNLPIQLRVAKRLGSPIAISVAQKGLEEQIKKLAPEALLVPLEDTYNLMSTCRLALATSGTVTLELALHGTPTVVNFAISPLDCFIAQKIFRINLPFYCIANIIVQKQIFPEFFGPNLTEETLYTAAKKLNIEECKAGCDEIRKSLGMNDAAERSAILISSLVN